MYACMHVYNIMYACIYVHTYVCTCVHTYVCMYRSMYACMYLRHWLSRALHALGSRAYISVKPLAAVLQYINVFAALAVYVCDCLLT